MESKPPLRERSWYAPVWWVLLIVSGLWTAFCIFTAEQIMFNLPNNMGAGFAAVAWEIILAISIPVYILFIALFFNRPKRNGKGR